MYIFMYDTYIERISISIWQNVFVNINIYIPKLLKVTECTFFKKYIFKNHF